ncbi:MAG: PEP/pyruvate-binding domain-containing protein [Gammaproteobacteria bacterium]
MTEHTESLIRWFDEIGIEDVPSVGGKGASLGELTRAGIPVPPGFIVTTAAFEAFIEAMDPDGDIRRRIEELEPDQLEATRKASTEIRERIASVDLPAELSATITAAYSELCGDEKAVPVAVRSSATSEDSKEASFAGLQDTFLWVSGEGEVIRWLRTCWSSLYSTESIHYRQRLNLPEAHVAMSVVVQRMVDARCSGVMFTRSPTTGDRSVITIEGSWGLGSCIVSGEVTPDKYVVNKVTGEIMKRDVADKTVQHVPDLKTGGVRDQTVPDDQRSKPCLSDEEIAELAGIGKRIEKHYGSPQDIEWAMDGDGAIYLLQSRPETVWAGRDAEQPVAKPAARPQDHVFALLSGRKR